MYFAQIRAGLTPKFKDVKVLCASLTYNDGPPHVVRYKVQNTKDKVQNTTNKSTKYKVQSIKVYKVWRRATTRRTLLSSMVYTRSLYTLYCILYTLYFILSSTLLSSMVYTRSLYTLYFILYTLYLLYTLYFVLCTLQFALCALLYTLYSVLYSLAQQHFVHSLCLRQALAKLFIKYKV